MNSMKKILFTLAFCMATLFSFGQSTVPVVSNQKDPLDSMVPTFEVENVTFVEALSELSREPTAGMHFGIEEVLRERTEAGDPRFSILLQNATIRHILDQLCGHDGRYMWERDGATINIYPKSIKGESSYLLNRHLEKISVREIPNPEAALAFLDRQLPPPREQLGYAGAGGDSAYQKPLSETFSAITIRQFINRISERMGTHTTWIFYGSKEERLFSFWKGGFH
jgi:hypothetical protein